jgi:DNA-binding MarR family transcriptional regulator
MQNLAFEMQSYLSETFGLSARVESVPMDAQKMPIFLDSLYSLYRTTFGERSLVLLFHKEGPNPSPAAVSKHCELLRKVFGRDLAFVFPRLASFERKRLVQHRVPFIVPNQQTYLPDLLIDLRDFVRPSRSRLHQPEASAQISTPAQVLLLYYLQYGLSVKPMALRDWTKLLGYSTMTTSRICDELVGCGLCEKEQHGKKVVLQFDTDRHALWKRALHHLRNPVLRLSFVNVAIPDNMIWLKAGLSALARYSSLAQGRNTVYAMKASEYRRAIDEGRLIEQPSQDEGSIVVEQWRYRPELLSHGNHTVDPLSLFLSLMHDPDERVESALDELMEGIKW